MTKPRPRTGNLLAMRAETGEKVDKIPAARFPVQHEIQQLQKELSDFNERIIELETAAFEASPVDPAAQIWRPTAVQTFFDDPEGSCT